MYPQCVLVLHVCFVVFVFCVHIRASKGNILRTFLEENLKFRDMLLIKLKLTTVDVYKSERRDVTSSKT